MAVVVLIASIVLQLVAVGLALRLIRLSGARLAWLFIAAAISLMLLRRLITFYRVVSKDPSLPPDLAVEWVALAISALMVVGIAAIGPVFSSIQRTSLALKENVERLRTFIKECPFGVAMLDEDLLFLAVSDRWLGDFGGGRTSLERLSLLDTFTGLPPHWPPTCSRVLNGSTERREEDEVSLPDGKTRWLRWEAHPWRHGDGKVGGIILYTEDITPRKKAEEELRRTEEQLLQAQKMEAVGRLAGGIAHDFNNLLTAILGYGYIARTSLDPAHPLQKDLLEIDHAGKRASDLTKQLLAFSRKQILVPRVLDLNAIVLDMTKMLRRVIGEHIEFSHNQQTDLGRVKADPSQIEQVLLNLAVNSRDAMPKGGCLTIETRDVVLDEEYARTHPECCAGSYVMLAVSDTGIGMDRETMSRIFEPFFTTKERGRGTGLGLATVFGIVKQSRGHISVYSEPNRGSTFKIYFPRVEEPAQPYKSGIYKIPPKGGAETILVVEDEEPVRILTCSVLKSHGYRVVACKNAAEALATQAASMEPPVQLMITDAVMPGMSGGQLAQKMKAANPLLKILHMSGYTEDAIVNQGELAEGTPFLPKPFTPEALLRAVRDALDEPTLSG